MRDYFDGENHSKINHFLCGSAFKLVVIRTEQLTLKKKMSTIIRNLLFLVTMLTLLGGFSMACNTNRPADRYWANDWDLPMDFSCHRGHPIKSLYSYWLDCRRDRVWSFECGNVGNAWYWMSCDGWTTELNEWDGPLFKLCENNGFVSGISSVHDNGKEDRRFKIKCCRSDSHKTCDCSVEVLNNFQAVLDYTIPEGKVLTGLYSIHRNDKEDRKWQAIICSISKKRGY
ncbi:hypothetical protein OS493_025913 [Desmophyllum pertusum]|uniref:Uncharacterized protein n=1 Tax=Desmophyllum pertusum TaxID=174260 RepID=A0A9X0CRD5_9CNID|nr:hypothetical protein OS493_025913 [Desmophyllum pertusum]